MLRKWCHRRATLKQRHVRRQKLVCVVSFHRAAVGDLFFHAEESDLGRRFELIMVEVNFSDFRATSELHLAWREGKLSWELQVLKHLWPWKKQPQPPEASVFIFDFQHYFSSPHSCCFRRIQDFTLFSTVICPAGQHLQLEISLE